MAKIKIKIKRPTASTFKGWTFVLVAGTVLAILALIDGGGLGSRSGDDGSTGCRLEVAADELFVRSGPSQAFGLVETLTRGATVDGTRVVTDGFRELEGGRWAANQFLTPLPGTICG